MRKQSPWFDGLLQAERFIRVSDIATAQFYLETELRDDSADFLLGWHESIGHYRRLEREGYVHPNKQ